VRLKILIFLLKRVLDRTKPDLDQIDEVMEMVCIAVVLVKKDQWQRMILILK